MATNLPAADESAPTDVTSDVGITSNSKVCDQHLFCLYTGDMERYGLRTTSTEECKLI